MATTPRGAASRCRPACGRRPSTMAMVTGPVVFSASGFGCGGNGFYVGSRVRAWFSWMRPEGTKRDMGMFASPMQGSLGIESASIAAYQGPHPTQGSKVPYQK